MEFLEPVKTIGALAGLVSAGFLIYDRALRNRPLAFLIPVEWHAHLTIKNVADETILLDRIKVAPPIISILMGNDTRSVVEAAAEKLYPSTSEKADRIFAVLAPQTERSFGLMFREEFKSADDGTVVTIACDWRNTRKPWPWRRHVDVRTTVGDLRQLQSVAQAHKDSP